MINALLIQSLTSAASASIRGEFIDAARVVHYGKVENFVTKDELCQKDYKWYAIGSQIAHQSYLSLEDFIRGGWSTESLIVAGSEFNDEVRHLIPERGDVIEGEKNLTSAHMTGLHIRELSKARFMENIFTGVGRIAKNVHGAASCEPSSGEAADMRTERVLAEVLPALGICLNSITACGWGLLNVTQLITRIGEEQVISKCTWVAVRFVDTAYTKDEGTSTLRRIVFIIDLTGRVWDAILSLRFHRPLASQIFKSENRTLERLGKFCAHMIQLFGNPEGNQKMRFLMRAAELLPCWVKTFIYIVSPTAHIGLSSYTFSDAFRGKK